MMNRKIYEGGERMKLSLWTKPSKIAFAWQLMTAILRLEWEGLLLRLALRRKSVSNEINRMRAEDIGLGCRRDLEVAEKVLVDLRRGRSRIPKSMNRGRL